MRQFLSLAVILAAFTAMALPSFGQNKLDSSLAPREVLRLREGWHFTREDQKAFSNPQYDDSQWSQVVVPHDWAIDGPFNPEIDKQFWLFRRMAKTNLFTTLPARVDCPTWE